VLGSAQRHALTHLREAGASTLDDTFTLETLKQAFRTLALRYHPDRHPGCTEQERGRLAAAFAGVHEAYRTLLGVTARTH
jgi:DnaJ-class molecular chaperone